MYKRASFFSSAITFVPLISILIISSKASAETKIEYGPNKFASVLFGQVHSSDILNCSTRHDFDNGLDVTFATGDCIYVDSAGTDGVVSANFLIPFMQKHKYYETARFNSDSNVIPYTGCAPNPSAKEFTRQDFHWFYSPSTKISVQFKLDSTARTKTDCAQPILSFGHIKILTIVGAKDIRLTFSNSN